MIVRIHLTRLVHAPVANHPSVVRIYRFYALIYMCDSNPKYPSTILSVTEFRCSGFAKLAPEYKAFALFLWRTISIGATSVVVVRVDVISREWETKETRAVRHENVGAVQEGTEQIWMRVLEWKRVVLRRGQPMSAHEQCS